MITPRPAEARGHFNFGWLDTHHSFSFGHYFDPRHMGFGPLRVINEDVVEPGRGFDTHGHSDMEIITYVLDGAVAHKDSLGNGSEIRPGDVQRMSAGSGIRHSEYNPSKTAPLHLLQIWLLPNQTGLTPSYEQKAFADSEKRDRLRLIVSGDGREGSVTIHQDADLYATVLSEGASVTHTLAKGRLAWVQVARGEVELNGETLKAGDGASVRDETTLTLKGRAAESEVILFDMPR